MYDILVKVNFVLDVDMLQLISCSSPAVVVYIHDWEKKRSFFKHTRTVLQNKKHTQHRITRHLKAHRKVIFISSTYKFSHHHFLYPVLIHCALVVDTEIISLADKAPQSARLFPIHSTSEPLHKKARFIPIPTINSLPPHSPLYTPPCESALSLRRRSIPYTHSHTVWERERAYLDRLWRARARQHVLYTSCIDIYVYTTHERYIYLYTGRGVNSELITRPRAHVFLLSSDREREEHEVDFDDYYVVL